MLLSAPRYAPPLEKIEFDSQHPRQIEYNNQIAAGFDSRPEEAQERIVDAIQFAKWMSPNQPEYDVLVTFGPSIHLAGECEGVGSYEIIVSHGSASFYVNDTVRMTLASLEDRTKMVFKLYRAWQTLTGHMPDGFIIYGPDAGLDDPNFAIREDLLTRLGFAPCEANGDRFGIVRAGQITPLTRFEFEQLTGQDGVALLDNQRFMYEKITWPGEEVQ
jgi:hypothetical protein